MERAIAYLRVSTRQQQRSGLGIDAQRATIQQFAGAESLTIAAEFVEFESGKGATPSTGARNWPLPWLPPKLRNAA
jgi:DNA invertase Pin-like site-specific DNA recombinase